MSQHNALELMHAQQALTSLLAKCEKVLAGGKLKPSQHTLTLRRVEALRLALNLIEAEQQKPVTVSSVQGIFHQYAKPGTTRQQERQAVEEAFARGEL